VLLGILSVPLLIRIQLTGCYFALIMSGASFQRLTSSWGCGLV
jgi:hypothetical protein